MLFSLELANNTILSSFFFFFLIIYLYFLIPLAIAQIFNPIAQLVISIGIPIKKANRKLKYIQQLLERVQYNLELYKPFCSFYSSIHFALFLQENSFLFHFYFSI